MFDQSFQYKLIQRRTSNEFGVLYEHIYSFNSTLRRYIVLVEEYPLQVFVPKFYPYTHRDSPNKYNVLLNDFQAPRIVRTCIDITLELLESNQDASFAFMGANTLSLHKNETKFETQRFRIYRMLMYNIFKKENWFHFDSEETSTYLLMPMTIPNLMEKAQQILKMFGDIYPDLESIELP